MPVLERHAPLKKHTSILSQLAILKVISNNCVSIKSGYSTPYPPVYCFPPTFLLPVMSATAILQAGGAHSRPAINSQPAGHLIH